MVVRAGEGEYDSVAAVIVVTPSANLLLVGFLEQENAS